MDYWLFFQEEVDFISRHIRQDSVQHNVWQGVRYSWYPVYACPLVTGQPDLPIACVTGIFTAEHDGNREIVYSCCFLVFHDDVKKQIECRFQYIARDGCMGPDKSLPFLDLADMLFPDFSSWLLSSPVPVLEGNMNHEIAEQKGICI